MPLQCAKQALLGCSQRVVVEAHSPQAQVLLVSQAPLVVHCQSTVSL